MKFSIKIGLHLKGKGEEKAVRLRVSWAGCRADITTGFAVDPAKWDNENSIMRANYKNGRGQSSGEVNKGVAALCSTAEDVLTLFELQNRRVPTVAEFKEAFGVAAGRKKAIKKKEDEADFFRAFDLFVSQMGVNNDWSEATYTKFASIRSHLKGWRSSLSLVGFSKEDFAAFVLYLQHTAKLLNTTVAKNVGFLRWFLRWAAANGYYEGKAHEQYRPRFKGLNCKEVIYLEWEELQNFLNFDFSDRFPSYALVRDVFCFCCFTGLRYSDVAKLKRSDLCLEAESPYIKVVTKKTTDRLQIELNNYALAILKKYEGVPLPKDLALPVISNAKMNEHLHDAAEAAGIDAPVRIITFRGNVRTEAVVPKHSVLTTHCGRKTFIVNALRLGIPPAVIMEWTGHSDFKAMKPYIKIVDAAKLENMEKFNELGTAKIGTRKSTRK